MTDGPVNITAVVTFESLVEMSGYKRPADVRRWLRRNGVLYLPGKGGRPSTTQTALDRAMLPGRTKTRPDFSEFETPREVPPQPRRHLLRS